MTIDRAVLVREMEAAWLRAPENARSAREAELCRMAAALAVAEEAIRADEREACAKAVEVLFLRPGGSSEILCGDTLDAAAAAIRARKP